MSNFDSTFSDETNPGPNKDSEGILDGSPFDSLRAALKAEVVRPDAVMNIPNRPTIRCIFSTFVDGDLFQRWLRNARIKGGKAEDVDALKLSSVIIAAQLKGLEVRKGSGDWEEATTNGQPMNFQNPALKELLVGDAPSSGAASLVRKLYANDGAILTTSKELLDLAGYGDESADLFGDSGDPTMG